MERVTVYREGRPVGVGVRLYPEPEPGVRLRLDPEPPVGMALWAGHPLAGGTPVDRPAGTLAVPTAERQGMDGEGTQG